MKVAILQNLLAPYRMLCNRHAMAPQYKSLQLAPNLIRGCASYGILETPCEMDLDVTGHCYVDAHTFLSVVNSLPETEEILMGVESGVLLWAAGTAKGKLATLDVPNMPEITGTTTAKDHYVVHAPLILALRAGIISCLDQSLQTVGMYGVVMDNRDFPVICTSDNTTISWATFGEDPVTVFPDLCYLSPDAVVLLNSIIIDGNTLSCFAEDKFLYESKYRRFLFTTVPPVKHDIKSALGKYVEKDGHAIPIPPDRIQAFIKRATALAESKRSTFVEIGAAEGHLSISFTEGAAQSDEYYLVDNKTLPDMIPARIDASKLARALALADELVMDYIQDKVLVLRHSKTGFHYVIMGQSD
jgi:hypothetical protein